MDNLGSQVGQKMRSAVKAKLIELGTGGAAGYIDDELPDYVMIMVANKRSKQQMISDLSLFLGAHTELFVTWLHEVLQKLQEVTLPATVVQKVKRKSSDSESNAVNTKKEKKEKKKDKKGKKSTDKPGETVPTTISDVFANHLLEKAKKSLPTETKTKKELLNEKNDTDEFDIPTITEISEQNDEQISREKNLTELAELQRKIIQAKRQLKGLESNESEDEDFLNIKEDAEEELEDIVVDKSVKKSKEKSPIVFEETQKNNEETQKNNEETKENRNSSSEGKPRRHTPIVYNNSEIDKPNFDSQIRKKSVHERLGIKLNKNIENVAGLATIRRSEKETAPIFRREIEKETKSKRQDNKMDTESTDEDDSSKSGKVTLRRRIGSRVIVAPPKPEYKDNEDSIDRPVNSLIKIKPRPPVSPSKQASKNLLLRAVAEAQKSTALVKPKKDFAYLESQNLSNSSRTQKLYTKSYRDRNREAILKRATKDNIIVEVNATTKPLSRIQKLEEDEYIPEPISDRGDSDNDYIYVPQTISSTKGDFEYDSRGGKGNKSKTQFVVTLDDQSREKYVSKHKIRVVEKNSGGIEIKTSSITNVEPPAVITEPEINKISSKHIDTYKRPKEIKKIIIKNDSEDDQWSSPSKDKDKLEGSTTPPLPKSGSPLKRKRDVVSPIKFDIDDKKDSRKKSKTAEVADKKSDQEKEEEKIKVSTKKSETLKKYENIPELSAVSIDSQAVKNKPKERCKYFPSCGKGDSCEFHHPTLPCKAFPTCKFSDKCLYLHPKCKFDLTCNRVGCNFSHSVPVVSSAAPPLPSHVVPVQNYKSITATPLPALCKYYPNCINSLCNFYHPKLCRFGKNCVNKVECNFYHHDHPNKGRFKWVASLG